MSSPPLLFVFVSSLLLLLITTTTATTGGRDGMSLSLCGVPVYGRWNTFLFSPSSSSSLSSPDSITAQQLVQQYEANVNAEFGTASDGVGGQFACKPQLLDTTVLNACVQNTSMGTCWGVDRNSQPSQDFFFDAALRKGISGFSAVNATLPGYYLLAAVTSADFVADGGADSRRCSYQSPGSSPSPSPPAKLQMALAHCPCHPGYSKPQGGPVLCQACPIGTFYDYGYSDTDASSSLSRYGQTKAVVDPATGDPEPSVCKNCSASQGQVCADAGLYEFGTRWVPPRCATGYVPKSTYGAMASSSSANKKVLMQQVCVSPPRGYEYVTVGSRASVVSTVPEFKDGTPPWRPCPDGQTTPITYDPEAYGYRSSPCQRCPAGKFNPPRRTGEPKDPFCLCCSPGTFSNVPGATQCVQCGKPGTSTVVGGGCFERSEVNESRSFSLNPGDEYGGTGAVSSSECRTACLPGQRCVAGCEHAAGSNEQPQCLDCPAGTYSPYFSVVSTCKPCQSGRFAATPGATDCSACPAGKDTGDRTGSAKCEQCPGGKYLSGNGCRPCKVGHYGEGGAAKCQSCSPGTYNGHVGKTKCPTCPKGRFTSSPGSTNCTLCDPGQYQPFSTQESDARLSMPVEPLYCPPGEYQPQPGQWKCFDAPPGSGTKDLPVPGNGTGPGDAVAVATSGNNATLPCGPGTYNDVFRAHFGTTGATTNMLECTRCPGNSRSEHFSGSKRCLMCDIAGSTPWSASVDEGDGDYVPLTNFLGGFLANRMANPEQTACDPCFRPGRFGKELLGMFWNVIEETFKLIANFFKLILYEVVSVGGVLGKAESKVLKYNRPSLSLKPLTHAFLDPFVHLVEPFAAPRTRCWCTLGEVRDCGGWRHGGTGAEGAIGRDAAAADETGDDGYHDSVTVTVSVILCVAFFVLLCCALCALPKLVSCCGCLGKWVEIVVKWAQGVINSTFEFVRVSGVLPATWEGVKWVAFWCSRFWLVVLLGMVSLFKGKINKTGTIAIIKFVNKTDTSNNNTSATKEGDDTDVDDNEQPVPYMPSKIAQCCILGQLVLVSFYFVLLRSIGFGSTSSSSQDELFAFVVVSDVFMMMFLFVPGLARADTFFFFVKSTGQSNNKWSLYYCAGTCILALVGVFFFAVAATWTSALSVSFVVVFVSVPIVLVLFAMLVVVLAKLWLRCVKKGKEPETTIEKNTSVSRRRKPPPPPPRRQARAGGGLPLQHHNRRRQDYLML